MSSRLGPIRIDCDAPPDLVVQKCERLGFESPLDVRWCRLSHFVNRPGEAGGDLLLRLWQWLFRKDQPKPTTCSCGRPLPVLQRYAVTLPSGEVADYLLGQCRRCWTIFWEEG
jgi:hypothetical protein